MKLIHFTLQPRAPVGTPYRGDTLLGHMLWQYAYKHGQDAMEEFFRKAESDPPACSDLFPKGRLPIPAYPLDFPPDDRKKLKRVKYLKLEQIKALQSGLTGAKLLAAIEEMANCPDEAISQNVSTLHASINRLTGTTTEDSASLFARPVTHYGVTGKHPKDVRVIVAEPVTLHGYLKPGVLGSDDEVKQLLKDVGEFGYGADSSSGLGVFKVIEFDDDTTLHTPTNANAWMSLSRHLIDGECNPHRAYYGVETHYGRLGGAFATIGNVFKQPQLLCTTGSLWSGWEDRVRGRIRDRVVSRDDVNIRHLGFTIPLSFHMEEEFK